MKKITLIILLTVGLFACQNLEKLNEDPNNSRETDPRLLLTQVEWEAFKSVVEYSPLYANKMLVQTDGENSYQYYKWDRKDFTLLKMRMITKMMEEAEKVDKKSYIAIGKFLRAYYFYNMALAFGDIPYSQALKGESENIYQPGYDLQKDVISGILNELEEANEMLKVADGVINGDIIYNGDAGKWRRLINAFRLKVLMSMSKKEGDAELDVKGEFSKIVTGNEPLFRNNQDNGQLIYLDQAENRYPLFNSSSFGSGMYIDSTFIKRLQDHSDPRLFLFCTQTKEAKEAGKAIDDFTAYEGGNPVAPYDQVNEKATKGKVSKVLERFYKDPTNEPSVLMGYAEQELILAEAAVRGWISSDAGAHYKNGVTASFKFYETYAKNLGMYVNENAAATYLANPLNDLSAKTTDNEKIEAIILQKYFRSFFQGGWSALFEHIRTGYPEYYRPAGVEVPMRWMYPLSEYNYNAEHVSAAIARQFGEGNDKINEKTWWLK